MTLRGKVHNGVVVLEEGSSLPDGTDVVVEEVGPQGETLLDRLRPFIGIANDLPSDMAINHDHYIHGTPRQ